MPKRRVILRGQLGADGPVGVADVVLQLHLLAVLEQRAGVLDHLGVENRLH
jgi:hypothetical protein